MWADKVLSQYRDESELTIVISELRQLAGGSGTNLGTGGMATKLQAADIARRAGVEYVIPSSLVYRSRAL